MAELREEQNAVRLARDKGITTSAVLQRRLTDVEDAFLRLTASLLGASDPIPLMRSNAGLMHTAKGETLGRSRILDRASCSLIILRRV